MKISQEHISFSKKELKIKYNNDEKKIEFDYLIGKIEIFSDCIVVMLDPPTQKIFNENIFCVSFDGEILWQIEKIEHIDINSPYTGIGKENELLSAYNWDGFNYLIDIQNGRIIHKNFVK